VPPELEPPELEPPLLVAPEFDPPLLVAPELEPALLVLPVLPVLPAPDPDALDPPEPFGWLSVPDVASSPQALAAKRVANTEAVRAKQRIMVGSELDRKQLCSNGCRGRCLGHEGES